MMANNLFTVALFGFSQIERTLIASVCKLSQARAQRVASSDQPEYQVVDPGTTADADILLIDGDDPIALHSGTSDYSRQSTTPLVMVSKAPPHPKPGEYALLRHRLGGLLLKSLDQIVDQWVKHNDAEQELSTVSKRKTCLVVDDSQLVRTQMEMILDEHPLDVTFAEDAETALQLVKEHSFDIIFLDVMLPEMNGYKACKLLKSDPKISGTPVVMLTSKKSPFNKMHGALVGCDKYLTKPVDPDRISKVLQQYDLLQTASIAVRSGAVPA